MDNKNKVNQLRKRWFRLGTTSVLLIGFGVSLVGEAIIMKSNEVNWLEWAAMGTFALVVLNAGLCVLGESVVCRSRWERAKENSEQ